ncbi:ScbR family autoregulator-binding transcription factor [Streptomyces sp. NPDC050617]|uniref:ScbR family autoregulator-binding transcription factor n=1 Tax=Streptomyces sp. NPDC050617 TaxID=3154628 RepID=UPI00343EB2C7
MVQQERAARTREALLRAAAETFDREGFIPSALTGISDRAGVSKGALHFHFTNKAGLAKAVEKEAATVLRAITGKALTGAPPTLQRLVDATHALAALLREDVVVRAGFRLCCERTHPPAEGPYAQWERFVARMLERADAEGSLAHTVSAREAGQAIVAATTGFELLGRYDRRWLSAPSLTAFWSLLLPRLATEPVRDRLHCGEVAEAAAAL